MMEYVIRKAAENEFHLIWQFYQELIETTTPEEACSKWVKGVYPAEGFLRASIRAGELYVAESGGEVLAAMVLNHSAGDAYQTAPWSVDANNMEVLVIHTLGVLPAHQGKGIAKAMVDYAKETACFMGLKAVRLDVLAGNTPAERLYPSLGFRSITKVKLYYENTGWHDFILMEYPIDIMKSNSKATVS